MFCVQTVGRTGIFCILNPFRGQHKTIGDFLTGQICQILKEAGKVREKRKIVFHILPGFEGKSSQYPGDLNHKSTFR